MSSASSNQSVVRDGVDYEEVYPSSHVDQESTGEERSSSASSSSSTNKDLEMAEPKELSDDGKEQTLRSVIGDLGSSLYYRNGRSITLYPPSRRIVSKHLGKTTKFRRTFPSVCPISQKNATMTL